MQVTGWMAEKVGGPMVRRAYDAAPSAGEVLVRVAGCGVCHTDLGFYYEGIPTRHPFPLVLGHEAGGEVVAVGPGVDSLRPGQRVSLEPGIPCRWCDSRTARSARYVTLLKSVNDLEIPTRRSPSQAVITRLALRRTHCRSADGVSPS